MFEVSWRVLALVAGGFLLSMCYDVGCPRHAEALTVVQTQETLELDFQAHPDNELIAMTIECHGNTEREMTRQGLMADLDPMLTHVSLRLPVLPEGYHCTLTAEVIRNEQHDNDSNHQHVAESQFVVLNT